MIPHQLLFQALKLFKDKLTLMQLAIDGEPEKMTIIELPVNL